MLEGPIFHFYDYGRKGKIWSFKLKLLRRVPKTSRLDVEWTWPLLTYGVIPPNQKEGSTLRSSNMAGWKIHHEWRCVSYSRWRFSIAMFVYRRVYDLPVIEGLMEGFLNSSKKFLCVKGIFMCEYNFRTFTIPGFVFCVRSWESKGNPPRITLGFLSIRPYCWWWFRNPICNHRLDGAKTRRKSWDFNYLTSTGELIPDFWTIKALSNPYFTCGIWSP